jgi:hypothetical protein
MNQHLHAIKAILIPKTKVPDITWYSYVRRLAHYGKGGNMPRLRGDITQKVSYITIRHKHGEHKKRGEKIALKKG